MTVHLLDDLDRPVEACGGDLTPTEQARERLIDRAVIRALSDPHTGGPHALHFISHTGRSWLYVCRCGEPLSGAGRNQVLNRESARNRWLSHRTAAYTGCCVWCHRRFCETGSTGLLRPTPAGQLWAHVACATDAGLSAVDL